MKGIKKIASTLLAFTLVLSLVNVSTVSVDAQQTGVDKTELTTNIEQMSGLTDEPTTAAFTWYETALANAIAKRDNPAATKDDIYYANLGLQIRYYQTKLSQLNYTYYYSDGDVNQDGKPDGSRFDYSTYPVETILPIIKVSQACFYPASNKNNDSPSALEPLKAWYAEYNTALEALNGAQTNPETGFVGVKKDDTKVNSEQGNFTVLSAQTVNVDGVKKNRVTFKFENNGLHPVFGEKTAAGKEFRPFTFNNENDVKNATNVGCYNADFSIYKTVAVNENSFELLPGSTSLRQGFIASVDIEEGISYITLDCKGTSYAPGYYKLPAIDNTAPIVNAKHTNNAQGGVTVTLTSNEPMQAMEGWTLSEDKLTATKDYAADYNGEVVVKDLAGNVVNVVLKVVMPDVTAPVVSISYAEKDNNVVTATITSNEPMSEVVDLTKATGWTLSEDKLTATKDFTTDYTGKVLVKDLAGNTKELEVKVVIPDTTAPVVTVDVAYSENGKLSSVMIYTNEVCKQPEGWLLPGPGGKAFRKEFTKNGTYTVVVEDLAGNTTSLSFEISGIKEEAKPTPTPQPTVKPEPTKKPVANGNGGYDDGGPFTTDKCGSVYDRWGNLMWKAPACNAHTNDGYTLVNTSDR